MIAARPPASAEGAWPWRRADDDAGGRGAAAAVTTAPPLALAVETVWTLAADAPEAPAAVCHPQGDWRFPMPNGLKTNWSRSFQPLILSAAEPLDEGSSQ
jgi:hypothetical protein